MPDAELKSVDEMDDHELLVELVEFTRELRILFAQLSTNPMLKSFMG